MQKKIKKEAFVVIGLGYGEEGKGLTTDFLCRTHKNPIVIRFNGGHQAGHTVTSKEGLQHVFSSFGAGTLRGVPTYWSKYCTFSPAYFLDEYKDLSLHVEPYMLLDRLSPITTHYDILFNRAIETTRGQGRFGSCGLGFGATIDRHHTGLIPFFAEDLLDPFTCREKLSLIRSYYKRKIEELTCFCFDDFDHDKEDHRFEGYLIEINQLILEGTLRLAQERDLFKEKSNWQTFIFEGAQGILLDQNFGSKPHITKSNTTSKNAVEMLERNLNKEEYDIEIYYVTRAYLTRHGAGPFDTNTSHFELQNSHTETNQFNAYQGEFKRASLDLSLLNYSLQTDEIFTHGIQKNLMITCLDQLNSKLVPVRKDGQLNWVPYNLLHKYLNQDFASCKFSFSNCSEDLF